MPEVGVPSRKAMKRRHVFLTRNTMPRKHACKIGVRVDTRCIFYVFLRGNTQKRSPDVTQLPFALRFRRNLTWETVGVTHTRTQKVGVFRPCWHIVTVQTWGVGQGLHA